MAQMHGSEGTRASEGAAMTPHSSSKVPLRVRRNCPWTEAEHRLFLLGLEKHGRGAWRAISSEFVTTRTATQVASHAQKYFLRDSAAANQMRKRQRPSIHDIRCATSVPATRLEQDQLKVSLQRINKQSMELEMNAANSEYAWASSAYGSASAPQSQRPPTSDDPTPSLLQPSQALSNQPLARLSADHVPNQAFWSPQVPADSQILAQNVLRGLLNSPFQHADVNLPEGSRGGRGDGAGGSPPFAARDAATAPPLGAHLLGDADPFRQMGDVTGVQSCMSPRAYAQRTSRPNSSEQPSHTYLSTSAATAAAAANTGGGHDEQMMSHALPSVHVNGSASGCAPAVESPAVGPHNLGLSNNMTLEALERFCGTAVSGAMLSAAGGAGGVGAAQADLPHRVVDPQLSALYANSGAAIGGGPERQPSNMSTGGNVTSMSPHVSPPQSLHPGMQGVKKEHGVATGSVHMHAPGGNSQHDVTAAAAAAAAAVAAANAGPGGQTQQPSQSPSVLGGGDQGTPPPNDPFWQLLQKLNVARALAENEDQNYQALVDMLASSRSPLATQAQAGVFSGVGGAAQLAAATNGATGGHEHNGARRSSPPQSMEGLQASPANHLASLMQAQSAAQMTQQLQQGFGGLGLAAPRSTGSTATTLMHGGVSAALQQPQFQHGAAQWPSHDQQEVPTSFQAAMSQLQASGAGGWPQPPASSPALH